MKSLALTRITPGLLVTTPAEGASPADVQGAAASGPLPGRGRARARSVKRAFRSKAGAGGRTAWCWGRSGGRRTPRVCPGSLGPSDKPGKGKSINTPRSSAQPFASCPHFTRAKGTKRGLEPCPSYSLQSKPVRREGSRPPCHSQVRAGTGVPGLPEETVVLRAFLREVARPWC